MKFNLDLNKFTLVEGDEYVNVYERRMVFNRYRIKESREQILRKNIRLFNESKKNQKNKSTNMTHRYITKEGIMVFTVKITLKN